MAATLNYTTVVPVARTVAEVQRILAGSGAASVAVDYDDAREPCAVAFTFRTTYGDRTFRLPVAVDQVAALLAQQETAGQLRRSGGRSGKPGSYSTPDQAARVAWRIVKDWLEAQLALIAAHLVTLDQVMLPYLLVDDGRTLYEAYVEREREQHALRAGEAP